MARAGSARACPGGTWRTRWTRLRATWARSGRCNPTVAAFRRMVKDTPALSEHSRRVWLRRHSALALAIAGTTDAGPLVAVALARFALDFFELADGEAEPREALRTFFARLRNGCNPHNQS